MSRHSQFVIFATSWESQVRHDQIVALAHNLHEPCALEVERVRRPGRERETIPHDVMRSCAPTLVRTQEDIPLAAICEPDVTRADEHDELWGLWEHDVRGVGGDVRAVLVEGKVRRVDLVNLVRAAGVEVDET